MNNYVLSHGTVQCYVVQRGEGEPHFMFHFGRAEYDTDRPVLSQGIRDQAQPIVDQLNAGTLTEAEAAILLKRIYF